MKFFTLILITVILFSGIALAQSSYTVEEIGTTFDYPQGWAISHEKGSTIVFISENIQDDYSPTILIELYNMNDKTMNKINSTEALRDFYLDKNKEFFDRLTIKDKSYDKKSNIAYARIDYNRKYDFTSLIAFVIKNKRGFSISYDIPRESFKEKDAIDIINIITKDLIVK